MTDPMTPPTELWQQWEEDWHHSKVSHVELEPYIATQAAQWGADQELEACCKWLSDPANTGIDIHITTAVWCRLRAARRPKSPSLAEQATAELDDAVMRGDCITTTDAMPLLRAALKRLAELEALPD
jgi:hypothetical protein